jgi:ABC-2 type transport system ATP-binding protein
MLIDGLDPIRDSLRVRQRVGYVPEQHFMHPWLRPPQVFAICAAAYPTWDRAECDRLVQRLGIPIKQRMQELSRGQQAKVALTIALSHRPQILIMDEPTSGLDPIVRREFLDMIGELIPQRRCTVLFSTHILSDIEHIADRIVVMNYGNVLADEPIEAMRSRYLQASLLFREPPVNHAIVPEALRVDRSLREWVILFPPIAHERVYSIAAELGAHDCMIRPATLENAFPELLREPKAAN